MDIKAKGWGYYQNMAIQTGAPHKPVNMTPLEDGTVWKIKNVRGGGGVLSLQSGYRILTVRTRPIGGM